MTAYQLDLFEEIDNLSEVKTDISFLKNRIANVQRGAFARIGNLEKRYLELTQRLDLIEGLLKK